MTSNLHEPILQNYSNNCLTIIDDDEICLYEYTTDLKLMLLNYFRNGQTMFNFIKKEYNFCNSRISITSFPKNTVEPNGK